MRLDDSICDFLLFYNIRFYSNTEVAPFSYTLSVTYSDGSNVRVSNYNKIIDKKACYFHSP